MVESLLARHAPRRLAVFSRDEFKQVEMERRLPAREHPALRYFIGDVRDRERLCMAMRGIDVVFHAAALKHVPTVEYNPTECIHTNVLGAENVIHAAIDTGVGKVVALSTDKAANPVNIPVNRQPYYRRRYGAGELPGAMAYFERCLSLPLFPAMADGDVDRVVGALVRALER